MYVYFATADLCIKFVYNNTKKFYESSIKILNNMNMRAENTKLAREMK